MERHLGTLASLTWLRISSGAMFSAFALLQFAMMRICLNGGASLHLNKTEEGNVDGGGKKPPSLSMFPGAGKLQEAPSKCERAVIPRVVSLFTLQIILDFQSACLVQSYIPMSHPQLSF